MASIDELLKKYWGYDSFRPLQRSVIESVLAGCDTLALMPTGGGKSITYQIPALAKSGICVVITPLISLMKDQVDSLRKRKIMAQAVHSGMTSREIDVVLDNCVYGDYKFLYVSPERLETDIFRTRFEKMNVSMIAVDEAHCISQWGYDFRPSYLNIAKIRALAPDAVMLAVTATATTVVVKDIQQKLGFVEENVFTMSFARHNISYIVRECEDKRSMILKIIYSLNGTGIVYCRTRKDCEELSAFLVSEGVKSDFYHGGLSYPMRNSKQEAWIKEQISVVVATNAFGMGIDKHNVRFVIHHDTPDTLEAYYQEAGRAGRDGKTSYAVLLSNKNDNVAASRRIEGQYPSIDEIKAIYGLICNYLNLAIGEGEQTVHDFNIYDFCSKFRVFSTNVLNSINILQLCGYMTITDNLDNPTRIHFSVSREELYRIQLTRNDLESFLSILLRSYTGLFSQFVPIDEHYLAHISGYTVQYINEAFKKLGQLKVINYIPCRQTPLLIMNTERLSPDNIRIDANQYSLRKEQSIKRLDSIFEYKDSQDKCRSLILQHYFGEQSEYECGTCDVCRAKLKMGDIAAQDKNIDAVKEVIIKVLEQQKVDIKSLMKRVKASQLLIERGVKELLESGEVVQLSDGNIDLIHRDEREKLIN